MVIVRAITMAAMLLACGKQRQKQWQQQQASGWSEERSSMTMARGRRAENIESCRLQFMVSFSVKSVFRRPKTAKIFRPAGASQRGELGLQTRENRPIAEFLQPAKRLHRCSGSKKSVI